MMVIMFVHTPQELAPQSIPKGWVEEIEERKADRERREAKKNKRKQEGEEGKGKKKKE